MHKHVFRETKSPAHIFMNLTWLPKVGDRVYVNGRKDEVIAVDQDYRVFLKSLPQHPYFRNQVNFRPTPTDYLGMIFKFTPVVVNVSQFEENPALFFIRCTSSVFNFTIRGKPKLILERLLDFRLQLVQVNNIVNKIVEDSYLAGKPHAQPKLQLVHSSTTTSSLPT